MEKQRIEFGKIVEGKTNAAFLVIYVEEISTKKYFKDMEDIKCPAIIMIDRWDGRIGFPGGTLEKDETLEHALQREIKEEIGINVKIEKLKHVVSFEWKIVSHLFAMRLTEMEFLHIYYHILNNFARSILLHSYEEKVDSHFLSEITGIKIVPILKHKGKGIDEFMKNNFAGSAKDDLEVFMEEILEIK